MIHFSFPKLLLLVLANARSWESFLLDTDASNVGIGAFLSQVHNGEERVIAYYSRTLSNPNAITTQQGVNFWLSS